MYLGLDIGTTATKAVLVDEHHAIVATDTARVQSVPAHPGNQRVQSSGVDPNGNRFSFTLKEAGIDRMTPQALDRLLDRFQEGLAL
jgi:glycerol kinase